MVSVVLSFFFFSSRRRHTRFKCDWSSDVCSSDLSHMEVVDKKKEGLYTPASAVNPSVPRLLDQILTRMLAADPQNRYQTASELIVDLERSQLAAAVPRFVVLHVAPRDPAALAPVPATAPPTR